MRVSVPTSVLVCGFVAGCAATVQGGLANAPTLAHATPETRVHDAVTNGRDSCERSAFPPGEVLRGQVPACSEKESSAATPTVPPCSSQYEAWISPFYSPSFCQPAGPGLVALQRGLAAADFPPPTDESTITCGAPL
jgi:hypothetical protein